MTKPPPRRRPGLTPMIDVVFLLLIFFMLASRFGVEGAVQVSGGRGGASLSGPPRLIDVYPDGAALNGVVLTTDEITEDLTPLMANPQDAVVLRARDGADVQRLVDVMQELQDAGIANLVLIE